MQSWNVVFNFFFFFFNSRFEGYSISLRVTLKMFHDADLFAVHKFHLEQAAKEHYHNHGFARLEIIVRGGCSILSGSLSAWDREQGSEGDDRKRCRRVTENVCCVNDAETLWRNLGQQRKRSIFFFLPPVPSHCSWNLSSLIYRILFSPLNRHRFFLTSLFLSRR